VSLGWLVACAGPPATAPAGSATAVPPTAPPVEGTLSAAGVIETRAPVPTATPGAVSQAVENTVSSIGLADVTFLGLRTSDWVNLFISLLIILGGYLLGTWVSRLIRNRIAPLLATPSAKHKLVLAGNALRWLITLLAAGLAVQRLGFIGVEIKQTGRALALILIILLVTRILWLLVDIADAEFRYRLEDEQREQEMDPALVLLKRIARIVLIGLASAAILSVFGVNLTAFAALLGIGGLAFSLAARSTIEDGISGAIILLDRPFRMGDRIEISAANTWGDVMEIGLRTTRVRTRDNRLVIIPNSVIVNNEIINYTYPDPTYRIETQVAIDYATDIEQVKQVLETAVRGVPDVLDGRPVDILYAEMGESAMIFRVRWWIGSYADTRKVTDKIHTAIHLALEEAQIVSPFPTQTVLIHSLSAGEE